MDSISPLCIVLLLVACTCIKLSLADSENVQDACPTAPLGKQTIFINGFPCKNPDNISASDFKTTKLSNAGDTDIFGSSVNIVTAADFPGLNTLGLSVGRIDLDVDGVVPTHSHPRASELFFVNKGIVLAGFLDTQNHLFQKVLKEGDVFVFPRGLLHFCLNSGFEVATAFSVFNSQNPGLVSIFSTFSDLTMEASKKQKRRLISLSVALFELFTVVLYICFLCIHFSQALLVFPEALDVGFQFFPSEYLSIEAYPENIFKYDSSIDSSNVSHKTTISFKHSNEVVSQEQLYTNP